MLAMCYAWEHLVRGGPVALQLIGEDHTRDGGHALEELAEEPLRGLLVPPTVHQGIEAVPILIHGPPQIVTLARGGTLRKRPELDKCLKSLKPDDVLIVWKRDWRGRSLYALEQLGVQARIVLPAESEGDKGERSVLWEAEPRRNEGTHTETT